MSNAKLTHVSDGTYQVVDGELVNYGEKFSYGYMVATSSLKVFRNPVESTRHIINLAQVNAPGMLLGVWEDPRSGALYVDAVTHVDSLDAAIALGKSRNELAIWSLRDNTEIYL